MKNLEVINVYGGNVLKGIDIRDESYLGFGEMYFSEINFGIIKGWKKHTEMTLNLIVAVGKIQFAIYNNKSFFSVILSKDNYQRLTVAPGLWVAFKGLSVENITLNLSNIEHDPNESINIDIDSFHFDWNKI